MRLLFASLARAMVRHAHDEVMIIGMLRRVSVDLHDEGGRFAARLTQLMLAVPAGSGIEGLAFHALVLREGDIRLAASVPLPAIVTFRLRLDALDVAALKLMIS